MIERYVITAQRVRQELADLERVIARAESALAAAQEHSEERGFYLDSAALNLHDFYTGIERALRHIAATIDGSVPAGREWHRDLLRQMSLALPEVRPRVLSDEAVQALDEYLRFRHVVRNIYAFEFDLPQVSRLVGRLRPTFEQVRVELFAFADFLDRLGAEGEVGEFD